MLASLGVRDLVITRHTSSPVPAAAWVDVVVWTVLMAGLAAWAYRHAEARRTR